MNILVTGANGQLGNEMRILAKESQDKYIFTDVNQVVGVETTYLDITDMEAIRKIVADNDVKVIVNCAAWTNVDACETDEKLAALAEKLNAEAPKYLAVAMREVGGLLVHVSTDYVFGAEPYNTPCKEDQQGTPTGVYGLTKLHGEQNIIDVANNSQFTIYNSQLAYVIIRTAWLYSEFGKNFCKTMLNLTATKPQLKVVFDQVGTPTYALDLAKAIAAVIEDYQQEFVNCQLSSVNYSKSGIYHYSNEGVCSWFDFTKMIAEYNGTTACKVLPCYSSDFPSPVKRPSYSVLDKGKIKSVFGVEVPYWTDSLKKCIANLKK